MTRTAYDAKNKVQVAILPGINGLRITQGANPTKNGTIVPATPNVYWTHNGYHATDHAYEDEENLYAPFDMECVKIDNFGEGAYFSFFRSLTKVLCADDDICDVSFLCVHGGRDIDIEGEDASGNPISKLKVGAIIRQGKKFYQMGREGLGSGPHVHIDIMKGRFADNFSYSTYMKSYPQNDYNGDFVINAGGLVNGEFIEDIFYKLPTDEILYSPNGKNWKNLINFKTYISEPFNPVGKEDGEYEYEGDHYYVINQDFAYGWQPETVEPDMQKYYDESRGGRRIDNDWAGYYYFTDENGFIRKNQWVEKPADAWFYLGNDGKFVTGWQFVKRSNTSTSQAWYYFNPSGFVPSLPAGQMLINEWIAGEEDDEGNVPWYYVKSNGEMAANETVNINGKDYRFDENGVCLNP